MAEHPRADDDLVGTPDPGDTREVEHERIRFSNDRDQAQERAGTTPPHARGYDEAAQGRRSEEGGDRSEDTDPDSAASDIDRDDTSDE